jgi:hypothetical protein
MDIPPRYISQHIQIHPPIADVIADEIHKSVISFQKEYDKLIRDYTKYTASWSGHQQMVFCDKANADIRKLSELIELLKQREYTYRSIMEWTYQEVENPAWEAYMRGIR